MKTVLFMHIPKTGGTSLIQIMEWQYGNFSKDPKSGFLDLSEWYRFNGKFDKPAAAGHIPYDSHRLFRDHQFVTMIRHPVDRIISLYHYINQLAGGAVDFWGNLGVFQQMPLLEFIKLPIANLHNGMTRQLSDQAFYFEPDTGKVTDRHYKLAKKRLKGMCIGLTDQFEQSAKKFAGNFGWKVNSIPHINKVEYPRLNLTSETMFEIYESIIKQNEYDLLLYHSAVAWCNFR